MKRLASAALRLYPRAWRERYGEEFVAMLETGGVGVVDVFDIVRGALRAQGGSMGFRQLVGISVALGIGMTAGYLARPYLQTDSRRALLSDAITLQLAPVGGNVRMTLRDRVIEAKRIDVSLRDGGLAVAVAGRATAPSQ